MRAALMYKALDVRVGQGADPYLEEAQGTQGAGAPMTARKPDTEPATAADRTGAVAAYRAYLHGWQRTTLKPLTPCSRTNSL